MITWVVNKCSACEGFDFSQTFHKLDFVSFDTPTIYVPKSVKVTPPHDSRLYSLNGTKTTPLYRFYVPH